LEQVSRRLSAAPRVTGKIQKYLLRQQVKTEPGLAG
jgi:hypothetical protein